MSLVHHMQSQSRALARLERVKPAYAAGLRGAAAVVIPVLVTHALALPGGSWIGLGGFLTTLADKGGSYRVRAGMTGAAAVTCALAAVIGSLAGVDWRIALTSMFLVVFLSSFTRVWGTEASTIASLGVVIFVVALASPLLDWRLCGERALWLLTGGAFSMFLSLVAWPLRVYQPAMDAVSETYLLLASAAQTLVDLSDPSADGAIMTRFQQQCATLRPSIEKARATVASIRRVGESGRGARLLVLIEGADRIFRDSIALGDVIDALRERGEHVALDTAREAARGLGAFNQAMADFIIAENSTRDIQKSTEPLRARVAVLAALPGRDAVAGPWSQRLQAAIQRCARDLSALAGNVAVPKPSAALAAQADPARRSLWAVARENLDFDSLVFRHALRASIAAALAYSLASAFHLSRGYWMTLSVIIILQPYTDATVLKGLQRVIGTVAGGLVAALLGAMFHAPMIILLLVFILTFTSLTLLPVNYVLYSMFLTPTFVLLAEVNAGDWHLVRVRIVNTLLGGAIALLAAALFWPGSERRRLHANLAAALRADRRYLDLIASDVLQKGDRSQLNRMRREVGLALINAETSYERLSSEEPGSGKVVDAMMTLTLYARRLAITLTSIQALAPGIESPGLHNFLALASAGLGEVAAAIEARRVPAAFVFDDSMRNDPLVDRIARHIEVLRDAAERAAVA